VADDPRALRKTVQESCALTERDESFEYAYGGGAGVRGIVDDWLLLCGALARDLSNRSIEAAHSSTHANTIAPSIRRATTTTTTTTTGRRRACASGCKGGRRSWGSSSTARA
jgi:hypothetical protein